MKALFILFTLIFSAYVGRSHFSNYYKIFYKKKINGYTVEAIWDPYLLSFSQEILYGPAIFTFENDVGDRFKITNNFFALPNTLTLKNGKLSIPFGESIYLDYDEPHFKGYLYGLDFPFLFLDLNFDGKKELIVTKFEQGQRYLNSYTVYSFDDFDPGDLESDLYQLGNKSPYNAIDDLTFIDTKEKSITLTISSGACSDTYKKYTLVDSEHTLTEIIQKEGTSQDNCYKLIYKVEDGCKMFLSKQKVE